MNQIDPTVVIRGDVVLGENNQILPYSVLMGPLDIGDDNIIGPHVVIGSPGMDNKNPRYDASQCRVSIGSHNIIREFTAIQKPCYKDITILGNHIHIMQGVEVPHDVVIEDHVVITPNCALGGVTHFMEGCVVALGCAIHQYSVIGPYCIVGMGSNVMKNVKPFSRYVPGKPPSINEYAIKKFGFERFREEIKSYVINSVYPTSVEIKSLVDRYYQHHNASERREY